MTDREKIRILLVEDDYSEQKLLKMLFAQTGYTVEFTLCKDGEEAIALISSNFNNDSEKIPDLVLMDMNLPKITGLEVLRHIKSIPAFRPIPVIILTTSNNENDIKNAYDSGACGYVRKPSGVDEYEEVIGSVARYWFKTCLL